MNLLYPLLFLGFYSGETFGFTVGNLKHKTISNALKTAGTIENRLRRMDSACFMSINNENNPKKCEKNMSNLCERRTMLQNIFVVSTTVVLPLISKPESAVATSDPLFARNPLTNPVLEKIRVWNQAEADEIKYGGELAPGSPKGRETYAKLLIPILKMEAELAVLDDFVHEPDGKGLENASLILNQPKYTKIAFKKVFNAFADNIYYSDPDRANLYLGGGAVPKNEQSIAYLLRNDMLTNIENLQAEVAYVIKLQQKNEPLEIEDMYDYVKQSRDAMKKYLELVPPGELRISRSLLSES